MDGKKTTSIGFKVSEVEKKEFEDNARHFGCESPAQLFRLLNKACSEIKNNGRKPVWPPELNYYPADTKTRQDMNRKKRQANRDNINEI